MKLEGENKRIVIKTTDDVYVQVMLTQPVNGNSNEFFSFIKKN